MLGIFLIYYIGKTYYQLAELYQKHKWGFAIMGVAMYYFGTFLGGVILQLLFLAGLTPAVEEYNSLVLNLLAFPFGLLTCWGLYQILKRSFSKKSSREASNSALDETFIK